ncbi:VOC family protein [uncultured Tenacibaculum sp.]|uniref:VOC family protein n=1 Tax=uncultured Tenacibaculum sp. TaxID=174713 RepID=UPI002611F3EF|nr:VOC family protein [uncultured Tenacibaculum sp.]
MNRFHFAFKVKDIESTHEFYHEILNCTIGRQTEHWIDFDFFGHQLSAHISKNIPELDYCGKVDNIKVPIPHFGCIVKDHEFEFIKNALQSHDIEFIIPPQTRYKGTRGEQKTMFVLDFSDNPIEFKSFKNEEEIF